MEMRLTGDESRLQGQLGGVVDAFRTNRPSYTSEVRWTDRVFRFAGNYANISPLMDILFGTYNCPDHEPEAFGVEEQTSQNYFGQLLIDPFKPNREKSVMQPPRNVAGDEL